MASEPNHPYVVLDVFTDTPLQGNPLAVFTDGEAVPEALMQRAARELNLSETVFLLPPGAGADARARIFTPSVELPFAGHPVLGSAFVVGERDGLSTVRLETGSGIVAVELARDGDGRIVTGEMSQPLPSWEPFSRAEALQSALGAPTSGLPVELYDNGPRFAFAELPDVAALTALAPDANALAALGDVGVSCFAVSGTDVRVRMFAPALGVLEDPATGSAAGPLAVHLCRHGRVPFGRSITITQGVEMGRPSLLHACAHGSAEALERVTVGGGAVVVARGEFRLA